MNKFGDEEKKRLKAKKESSTANRRRSIAIQRVGAASQRRLELKSLGVLIMSTRASVGQGLASGSTRQPIGEQQPRKSGWRFSRRSSQSARESVRSSARDSQSRLSAAPLPVPVVALQGHWRQIYDLLLDSSDDATLREVARQAFADNPQKVVDHAGWLAEQLHAAEQLSAAQKRRGGSSSRVDGSSSWSDVNVKVEVLRLFANLLPDQLQSPEGALVVDSTLCTLNALAAAPPSPSPSRQKTNAPPGSDAPSPAELRADLVTFAKQILHKAPRITLEPLAKKLVDLALQPEDPELHAEGRQLLQKLGVKQRQEAAKAMLDILKEAPAPAGPTKSEPFTSLLTALAHDNPTVLSPHVDTLMELAASESKLAASVAAETLPGMAQDANIFGQLVKQVEAKDVDADKVVNALTLIGKLDPALISRHDKAQLFFRRCLWHKDRKVFLLFENAILGKEGWTGALLAPFCSLLIEAMEAAAGAGGEDRRQSLVRALAKLSVNVLMPHLDALRGLMEREEIHGVRLAMLELPPSIRDQCLSVGWLGDLNPTYN